MTHCDFTPVEQDTCNCTAAEQVTGGCKGAAQVTADWTWAAQNTGGCTAAAQITAGYTTAAKYTSLLQTFTQYIKWLDMNIFFWFGWSQPNDSTRILWFFYDFKNYTSGWTASSAWHIVTVHQQQNTLVTVHIQQQKKTMIAI